MSSAMSSLQPDFSVARDPPKRDLTQARVWFFLLHGVFMIVAFLGIFALGILYGRFGRTYLPATWFKHHRAIQVTGLAFTLIGAILGIIAVQVAGAPHFALLHQKLGLAIIILVVLQAIGGQAGHVIRQKYGRRSQNAFHVLFGIAIFALASLNIQYGLDIWGWRPSPVWKYILGTWSIILGLVYIGGLTLIPSQRREELERASLEERTPLLR
ncbi:hypothetical protein OC846_002708 [Tilletia horrida]|uniref:Cytochrome b561 domain-containing protein n=1 Tax=Tilletia horrida TaxID=155126 RepID=A0AAN6GQR0_9BASI|nr:hypothetical protein OC845_003398 [Tilletia horrida]KAK0552870.1 hypothetical protein OC846_002708 [Tilletia horrida]KAK0567239.1 hypothetical protein OC861_002836 [Tilletia horrida]